MPKTNGRIVERAKAVPASRRNNPRKSGVSYGPSTYISGVTQSHNFRAQRCFGVLLKLKSSIYKTRECSWPPEGTGLGEDHKQTSGWAETEPRPHCPSLALGTTSAQTHPRKQSLGSFSLKSWELVFFFYLLYLILREQGTQYLGAVVWVAQLLTRKQ